MKRLVKWALGLLAAVVTASVGWCEYRAEQSQTRCLNETQALHAMQGVMSPEDIKAQEKRVLDACGSNKPIKWTWT